MSLALLEELFWDPRLDTDLFPESVRTNDYPCLTIRRLITIFISLLVWKTLQKLILTCTNIDPHTAFRIVSSAHASTAVGASSYVLYHYHPIYPSPTTYCKPIPMADLVFCVSYGYFLYDLWKNISIHGGKDFIMHASASLGIYTIMVTKPYGHRCGITVLLFEISTIFLHAYAFLFYGGLHKAASLARLLFAFLFFVLRIILGSYITLEMFDAFVTLRSGIEIGCIDEWAKWTSLAINLSFHLLNCYWFILILGKAKQSCSKRSQDLKSKKQLDFDTYRNKASAAAKAGKHD